MKKLVLLTYMVVILILPGCRLGNQQSNSAKAVEIIIEGGGNFPEFLAGRWKANKAGWEFVFEPDGRISSAVINLGRIRIKPGEITEIPMRKGGKGIFEPGQWMVYYDPNDSILTAQITLDYFRAELGDDILEGKSTDIFAGKISPDGASWYVDWTNFFDYTAHTEEYPDYKMTVDPNYGTTNSLVFEKITNKSN